MQRHRGRILSDSRTGDALELGGSKIATSRCDTWRVSHRSAAPKREERDIIVTPTQTVLEILHCVDREGLRVTIQTTLIGKITISTGMLFH